MTAASEEWTDQADVLVLDNGLLLTPWGSFKVDSMIRCNTIVDGHAMQACRVRLTPIDSPKVGLVL